MAVHCRHLASRQLFIFLKVGSQCPSFQHFSTIMHIVPSFDIPIIEFWSVMCLIALLCSNLMPLLASGSRWPLSTSSYMPSTASERDQCGGQARSSRSDPSWKRNARAEWCIDDGFTWPEERDSNHWKAKMWHHCTSHRVSDDWGTCCPLNVPQMDGPGSLTHDAGVGGLFLRRMQCPCPESDGQWTETHWSSAPNGCKTLWTHQVTPCICRCRCGSTQQ